MNFARRIINAWSGGIFLPSSPRRLGGRRASSTLERWAPARAVVVLLVLWAVAGQSMLPLLAAAKLARAGFDPTAIICTASGIRTITIDGHGREGGAPEGGRHLVGDLDCLLCCVRIGTSALAAVELVLSKPHSRRLSHYDASEVFSHPVRIGSKGPRGPPVV